jgi:hypothetical protein
MSVDERTADVSWRALYRNGGVAAAVIALLIPVQGAVFAMWPPPATVIGWFTLFQKQPWVGLLDMDLLLAVDDALLLVVFLALWAALEKAGRSLMALALLLQSVSVATYFASTAAFEMLALSKLYAVASHDSDRSVILAAGQAMLVSWQGTAFNVSYLLGAAALLCVSVVMLRSTVFSRATAYLCLVAGLLMTVPPTAPTIGIAISLLSLIPTIPWLVLIAVRFHQLSQAPPTAAST